MDGCDLSGVWRMIFHRMRFGCFLTGRLSATGKYIATIQSEPWKSTGGFFEQLEYVKQLTGAMGYGWAEKRTEADDLIATKVNELKNKDCEITIVSSDKDLPSWLIPALSNYSRHRLPIRGLVGGLWTKAEWRKSLAFLSLHS